MFKILVIIGTRPEAIKLAPVVSELLQRPHDFECRVLSTGQHREMLKQTLDVFGIVPDIELELARTSSRLEELTSLLVSAITIKIRQERPDMVIVQGDTTSTFIGALAAFYEKVVVGHVEAGLRSHDRYQPFPEEINRKLTSVVATFHFAPTELARAHLLAEGIEDNRVFVTGNTVIDSLLQVSSELEDRNHSSSDDNKTILVTLHRRENWDKALENLCQAISALQEEYANLHFIFATHMNPLVRDKVLRLLQGTTNVTLVDAMGYVSFVQLMQKSYLIITDSGGVQEEAPSLGKPVLVLRNVTERPEGVDAGTVKVIGTEVASICTNVSELLSDPLQYEIMARANNPYGDGQAAKRIVDIIEAELPTRIS